MTTETHRSHEACGELPRVLMLAYEFPPMMSSGCSRPLATCRYLREFGFEPMVITVAEFRGVAIDHTRLELVPEGLLIERVMYRQRQETVAEHGKWLSAVERFVGKPEGSVARGLERRLRRWFPAWCEWYHGPPRTWRDAAIERGITLVRKERPTILWATGPTFDTLKAGAVIAEHTGLPLIADVRDPWTYGVLWNPRSTSEEVNERRWERRVFEQAARVVVTSPLTERAFARAYPELSDRFVTILNGFEETPPGEPVPRNPARMTMTYTGRLGTQFRRPDILFDALELIKRDAPRASREIVLRLVGGEESIDAELKRRGLTEMVENVGVVSFSTSKEYMQASDVLLVLQLIEEGNDVIGGKVYEYLAARKPIIGVVSPGGGDEWLIRESGAGETVGIHDAGALADCILRHHARWQAGGLTVNTDPQWLAQFNRRALTGQLADLMREVLKERKMAAIASATSCVAPSHASTTVSATRR